MRLQFYFLLFIILVVQFLRILQGIHILNVYCSWRWSVYRLKPNSVAQEPEDSSPRSQQPATGPCTELVESNPHPPSQSPQDPFWSYRPTYALVFRVVSFLLAFPPKPCTLSVLTPTKSYLYFPNSLANVYNESDLYRLLTFHVPNLMSIFRCLGCAK
jgi:hypothetical protein